MLQFNLNKGKKEKERKKERKRRRGRERNKGERNESTESVKKEKEQKLTANRTRVIRRTKWPKKIFPCERRRGASQYPPIRFFIIHSLRDVYHGKKRISKRERR